ncbi:C2H2-like zinc finger protein [Raphanus sativus]|uniref:Uncharacterized protein LOC108821548 n=1 Tax=Raphanus sativus TaxID=3726 RepID=A0A6J0KRA7_RAPSA|nr:uncharacterized protein LOC108821548 [Raphanus sativus]KAJ4872844.1 C2H2-like zinc finger protein [Raphanus sativus]
MEQFQERKFVCRFCSKRFPCGKSLGGHIRTHMNQENSADSDEDELNKLRVDESGGQSSYGLRENPKKNKRFVVQRGLMALKHQQQQLLCCRECGKGFPSSKALCGHMACHTEREKIVMDSQSETEASSSPMRRRSKRAVKHQHHYKSDAFVVGGSITNQYGSASSDDTGIEPEQEEMALSLMMLSRDSSFKKGHNMVVNHSLAESSDNYSVILETKSSSGEQLKRVEEFCKKDKLGGADNSNQLKSGADNGDVLYDSDNSDSGYFRNGPKKLDSDVSVDGFLRNTGAVMGFNSSTTKEDKNMNRFKKEWSGTGSGRSSTKYDLRKTKRGFPCYGRKKLKYELTESVYDSGDQLSLETESCADTIKIHSKATMVKKASGSKKKSKGHECPICFRVFKSGQALGGHKRSHFLGNHEHRTLVIQQQHQVAHEMHTLIDLNLPAPID